MNTIGILISWDDKGGIIHKKVGPIEERAMGTEVGLVRQTVNGPARTSTERDSKTPSVIPRPGTG